MKKFYLRIVSAISVVAGLLHTTVVAFDHLEPLPLETAFFAVFGLLQGIVGVFAFRNSKFLNLLFITNGGLALMWVLSSTVYTPFMSELEGISFLGILVFLLEIISMVVVYLYLRHEHIHLIDSNSIGLSKRMLLISALALFVGGGFYGTGIAGEIIFPDRVITHSHGMEGGGHQNGMDKSHKEVGQGFSTGDLQVDDEGQLIDDTSSDTMRGQEHESTPHGH